MIFATLLLSLPIAQFPQQPPQMPRMPQQPPQMPQGMPQMPQGGGGIQIRTTGDFEKAADSIMSMMLWVLIVVVVIAVPVVIGMWRIYEKANEPGWACLVPIYNMIVLARIAGKPEIWGLLTLIPLAGLVFYVIMWIEVCNKFGQGAGYAVGILLLPFVFVPMLGFGSAEYEDNAYRRRRRRARWEDDRPRKRRARVEEDEDEAPRPRKRRVVAEDEEDEEDRPRKRRPVAEDDEDEEPRPRRKPDPRVRKRDDRYSE